MTCSSAELPVTAKRAAPELLLHFVKVRQCRFVHDLNSLRIGIEKGRLLPEVVLQLLNLHDCQVRDIYPPRTIWNIFHSEHMNLQTYVYMLNQPQTDISGLLVS